MHSAARLVVIAWFFVLFTGFLVLGISKRQGARATFHAGG